MGNLVGGPVAIDPNAAALSIFVVQRRVDDLAVWSDLNTGRGDGATGGTTTALTVTFVETEQLRQQRTTGKENTPIRNLTGGIDWVNS